MGATTQTWTFASGTFRAYGGRRFPKETPLHQVIAWFDREHPCPRNRCFSWTRAYLSTRRVVPVEYFSTLATFLAMPIVVIDADHHCARTREAHLVVQPKSGLKAIHHKFNFSEVISYLMQPRAGVFPIVLVNSTMIPCEWSFLPMPCTTAVQTVWKQLKVAVSRGPTLSEPTVHERVLRSSPSKPRSVEVTSLPSSHFCKLPVCQVTSLPSYQFAKLPVCLLSGQRDQGEARCQPLRQHQM